MPYYVGPTLCLAQRAPPFKSLFKSLLKPFLSALFKPLFMAFGEALIAGILEESPPIPLRYLLLKLAILTAKELQYSFSVSFTR